MKKRNIVILSIVVLVIAGVGFGFIKYFQKTDDVVNRKADYVVDVKSLLQSFETDSAASNQKYNDKVLMVTGNVKRIDTSGAVVLGDESSPSEVVAGIDRRHIEDLKQLQIGKSTNIQGTFTGFKVAEGNDLLSSLGTTIELKAAGVKR